MDFLHKILGDEFPSLLVMEYLPGDEYTVDVFRSPANTKTIAIPRKRRVMKNGITFSGVIEKNDEIIDYTTRLANEINMEWIFGFQFKMGGDGIPKLLECNPRVQGTMVMSTLAGANLIYASVKNILSGEIPPMEIKWGMEFVRYWGGLSIYDGKLMEII
ncbi:MAG: ATP-grasp domain-containing protein [Methanomassiliicoccales archaeon]